MADAKNKLAYYSSAPIQAYRVGPFRFEKGVLTFDEGQEDELESFETLLETLPAAERARVQKVDVEAAEAYVRDLRAQSGGATRGIDSSIGDRATKPKPEGDLGNHADEQARLEAEERAALEAAATTKPADVAKTGRSGLGLGKA